MVSFRVSPQGCCERTKNVTYTRSLHYPALQVIYAHSCHYFMDTGGDHEFADFFV